MSWKSCMEKKIQDHYGSGVDNCLEEMNKDNLREVAQCIVEVLGGASTAEVLANLTAWSAECVF